MDGATIGSFVGSLVGAVVETRGSVGLGSGGVRFLLGAGVEIMFVEAGVIEGFGVGVNKGAFAIVGEIVGEAGESAVAIGGSVGPAVIVGWVSSIGELKGVEAGSIVEMSGVGTEFTKVLAPWPLFLVDSMCTMTNINPAMIMAVHTAQII
jgi:hypothetical protein